jgi:hypothetical protein
MLRRGSRPVCAILYGPAARRKTDLQDDEREVLHQCIRPRMWSMLLRASMGIRAHPRLTSGKASVDHYGTQSRGCAGQTVRPSLHSISQTSVGKLLNRLILKFHFLHFMGSREAIPSEPPSLARQDWRAMVAEREGVHPLGKPERADLKQH